MDDADWPGLGHMSTNGVGDWGQQLNHIEGKGVSGGSPKENHDVVTKKREVNDEQEKKSKHLCVLGQFIHYLANKYA